MKLLAMSPVLLFKLSMDGIIAVLPPAVDPPASAAASPPAEPPASTTALPGMKPFSAVALRAPGLLLLGAAEAGGAGSILVQAEQQRGGQATLGELRARSAQASK